MSGQRLVECFEGTPVSQLGWWDLARYNVALTRANSASGTYVTGNTNERVFAEYGITFEIVTNNQQGANDEK